MPATKYLLFKLRDRIEFVEMPGDHAYQLTALNRRLHKEIDKLTAQNIPQLPYAIAECEQLELLDCMDEPCQICNGLEYLNELERSFAAIDEKTYPLISLLTEIRALQAQMEQCYEEEM